MGDDPPWTTSRGSGSSTTSQNLTQLKILGRKNGGESLKGELKYTLLLQKFFQAMATRGRCCLDSIAIHVGSRQLVCNGSAQN